ncbi:MAG: blaR, partial [Phycisphaerales bacterium]|nr:blaR [Phycisphaerales bacterium]
PGDPAVRLAASVAAQVAGIVLVAWVVGRTVARRRAALRHGIWLAALAWAAASPLAAWGLGRAGVGLVRLPLPDAPLTVGPSTETGGPALSVSATSTPQEASPWGPKIPERQHPLLNHRGDTEVAPPGRVGSGAESFAPATGVAPATPPSRVGRIASHPTRSDSFPDNDRVLLDPPASAPVILVSSPARRAFEAAVAGAAWLWAVGAALLLARVGWGLAAVARARRAAVSADDAIDPAVGNRVRRTLGVPSLPPVLLSDRVGGPVTVGAWRPVVLLPTALFPGLSPQELHDVLAHEAGHARRHDPLVGLAQRVVGAVLWLHPLVPLLNRELRRAREEACDDGVLRGQTPAGYARTLLSLAEKVAAAGGRPIGGGGEAATAVGMLGERWRLEHRVAGLLDPRRSTMNRIGNRAAAAVAAGTIGVGVALAAVGAAAERPGGETSTANRASVRPGATSAMGPTTAPAPAASRPADAGSPAASLRAARDAAEQVLKLLRKQWDLGEPYSPESLVQAAEWSRRAAVAGTDPALPQPERLAAAERHLGRAQEYRKLLKERFAKGLDPSAIPGAEADHVVAEAEVWVARAKAAAVVRDAPLSASPAVAVAAARPPTADASPFLTPADDAVRKKVEVAEREVRRAELDVREASLKLQRDEQALARLQAAYGGDAAATNAEVEQAQVLVELDRVQVERTGLALAEVKAGADESASGLPVGLIVYKDFHAVTKKSLYSVRGRNATARQLVKQSCGELAVPETWCVQLRRPSTAEDWTSVAVFDVNLKQLLDGTVPAAPVRPGDCFVVRQDAIEVVADGSPDHKPYWTGKLGGTRKTVRQVLAESAFPIEKNDTRKVFLNSGGAEVKKSETDGLPWVSEYGVCQWSATLKEIAAGTAPEKAVAAGDSLFIK